MSTILRAAAALVFLVAAQCAAAAPASDASVRQLLEISQARKLVDAMLGQVDAMMTRGIQDALKGNAPTPKQEQAIAKMKNEMVALLKEQLTWEKLEPMYLRLYRETFTEDEVQGMLVFYRTPAGQAVIHKMPVLMQRTMTDMQQVMSGLMPRMQKIQEEFVAEAKAGSK